MPASEPRAFNLHGNLGVRDMVEWKPNHNGLQSTSS